MNIKQLAATTRASVLAAGLALAAASLMGCGAGEAPRAEAPIAEHTAAPTSAQAPTTPPAEPAAPVGPMRAVSIVEELVVRDRPDGVVVATVAATTAFGTPSVLGVTEPPVDGWVPVLVNARPNGLAGYVAASDVHVEAVPAEIFVDLTARTLRLVEHGVESGIWPVAIGTPDRPTPTGRFFITDKLATGDPASVWGEVALGVSGYSNELHDFIGGVGQIGIHGTNNPASIGQAASSGCIRLPNEVIAELIDRLPLGTPVHIS